MGKYLKSVGKNSLDFLKYVGPGLLVTVGFIDPGNWASNIAAGSGYGYSLLWMVTLSTVMLIIMQRIWELSLVFVFRKRPAVI